MAKNNQVNLPSSSGGITRYFDKTTSNVVFSPKTVIIMCVAVIVFMIILHMQFQF